MFVGASKTDLMASEYDLIFYLMIGRVDLDEMDIYHITGDLVI